MSTSGEQPTRPLTRRELRELRAQGGEAAVRAALDADSTSLADAAARETAASGEDGDESTSAVETPAEPNREPNVVATSSPEADERPPLTRKELRRLRTNEVPIVTAVQEEPAQTPETPDEDGTGAPGVESDAPSRAETPSAVADESPADDTMAFDVVETDDQESADDETADPAVLEPTTTSTEIPTLNPSFGAGVGQHAGGREGPTSFDALMEQQYTQTSPSSIIMTSSLSLPDGIGSTGAAKGTTDGREVDAVLIDGELPASSSPTPIAASAAISTQKSAHEVIRPPSPDKGRGLLLALGITAGALGIVAIGTLATLYFTGVFN